MTHNVDALWGVFLLMTPVWVVLLISAVMKALSWLPGLLSGVPTNSFGPGGPTQAQRAEVRGWQGGMR